MVEGERILGTMMTTLTCTGPVKSAVFLLGRLALVFAVPTITFVLRGSSDYRMYPKVLTSPHQNCAYIGLFFLSFETDSNLGIGLGQRCQDGPQKEQSSTLRRKQRLNDEQERWAL